MNTAVATLELTREDWLKVRQSGIGSSDVGAILGLSKYKTALEVYNEKIAEFPIDTPETPAMRRGILMESLVADEYARMTNQRILRDNKVRIHVEHPFMLCNLDRIIVGEEQGVGILEIKTTTSFALRAWEEEIPLSYWAQIQHQLFVTGYTWGVFAVLVIDTWELRTFPVTRDDSYLEKQNAGLFDFWLNHVIPRIPPEATAADFAQMEAAPGKTAEATDEIIIVHGRLNHLREQRKHLDAHIDAIMTQLQEFMGTAEILLANGTTLATWKTSKPTEKFDAAGFRNAVNREDLALKFITPKPGSRRFTIKGVNDDNE